MMLTLWIVWAVLTIIVITLAVYRKLTAGKEDAYVHLVDGEANIVSEQATVAQKLDKIDSWGKTLTIVDVAYLVVLLSVVCYNAWHTSLDAMQ